MLALPSVPI